MSFSDFILAILVLAVAGCIMWVYDINPYSTKLHVYTQTCDNMILDNTYCKGNWIDNPTSVFTIDKENNAVTYSDKDLASLSTYSNCSIIDRKNWTCIDDTSNNEVIVKDGILAIDKNSDLKQITRLEWLQNKLLEIVS